MFNITVQQNKYHNFSRSNGFSAKSLFDTTALYEGVCIAEAMFPGRWEDFKNNFSLKWDKGSIVFTGMGLEKDISLRSGFVANIDYRLYGRALYYANNFANKVQGTVFVVPNTQAIANSVILDFPETIPENKIENINYTKRLNMEIKSHKLVNLSKRVFYDLVKNDEKRISVDPKDLIYQCLFRLMSYEPSLYCRTQSTNRYFNFDYDESEDIIANHTIFKHIYNEQKRVLYNEYYREELELYNDLSQKLKSRGILRVINAEPYLQTSSGEKIRLEFKEVPELLANRIHRSFHYIHTPRNKSHVFGLFIKGDSVPISVIGVERVQRDYKKHSLLQYCISPEHTYELTRMYSCNNSPANTSSFMLSITNSYLKRLDKKWQASISSFMPSYATGLSMISGGFENILYAKECLHKYQKNMDSDISIKTNRSLGDGIFYSNKTRLMPVLELIYTKGTFLSLIRKDNRIAVFGSKEEAAK